jgi:hypothetical protein
MNTQSTLVNSLGLSQGLDIDGSEIRECIIGYRENDVFPRKKKKCRGYVKKQSAWKLKIEFHHNTTTGGSVNVVVRDPATLDFLRSSFASYRQRRPQPGWMDVKYSCTMRTNKQMQYMEHMENGKADNEKVHTLHLSKKEKERFLKMWVNPISLHEKAYGEIHLLVEGLTSPLVFHRFSDDENPSYQKLLRASYDLKMLAFMTAE